MMLSCSNLWHIKECHQLLAITYRGNPCSVGTHITCTASHSETDRKRQPLERSFKWIQITRITASPETLRGMDISLQRPSHPANGKDNWYWLPIQCIKYVQFRDLNLLYSIHSPLQQTRSVKCFCMHNQPGWVYRGITKYIHFHTGHVSLGARL